MKHAPRPRPIPGLETLCPSVPKALQYPPHQPIRPCPDAGAATLAWPGDMKRPRRHAPKPGNDAPLGALFIGVHDQKRSPQPRRASNRPRGTGIGIGIGSRIGTLPTPWQQDQRGIGITHIPLGPLRAWDLRGVSTPVSRRLPQGKFRRDSPRLAEATRRAPATDLLAGATRGPQGPLIDPGLPTGNDALQSSPLHPATPQVL